MPRYIHKIASRAPIARCGAAHIIANNQPWSCVTKSDQYMYIYDRANYHKLRLYS